MECLACHAPNIDGARFCEKCGAPLPQEAAADPLIGQIIGGRYKVIGVLGEGGMGRVYHAEQRMGTSVRKVAVKTLLSQFAKDPQTVARFMREVGTVSELEHPNTIKVYDFGQTDSGELYIAMELLQGQSLDEILASGHPLPPERVDRIVGQVCGSLQEAHDKGIVHRDLKPANIFLTTRAGEEDVVKVLDFGIAKKADSKDSKQEQKLTQQGTILGTPPYMSPEQFTGKELDPRSDLYSLGVVVYEMLTGRLPFDADTPWQWMTAHMTAQPFPFETIPAAASVPPKMRQAVHRALAKEKEQRPSTARDFYEDLTLGTQRMSVLGLGVAGAAGAAAMVPSSGTAMLPAMSNPSVNRPGQTQIGEPLFPDGMAPGGAGKTMMGGETLPSPIGAYAPAVAAAPPPQASPARSGGPSLALIGVIGFLVIGGGLGGFFMWKRSSADAEGAETTIQVPTAKPSSEPSAQPVGGEDPTIVDASSSTGGDTASTSTASEPDAPTTGEPTATPPPTTQPSTRPTTTTTAKPPTAQGIDGCCAAQKTSQKRGLCQSYNRGIKSGTMNRNAALAQLRAQGINCQ
jgi:eukaryotic-like serine/threonine-protein kinase